MPARDLYHDTVVRALRADDWEITHDLAVPRRVSEGIFAERLGQVLISLEATRLVVFDEHSERIVRWVP